MRRTPSTAGRPVSRSPWTWSCAYDVPAGHRLAVVVDTVDLLYIEHNPSGAQLTFSSRQPTRRIRRSRCARSDHRLLPAGSPCHARGVGGAP
ncbi:CocE/NonD family hydrolase C-terminal non-catalytic domain-containing protein [Streptomyces peucetius]|uniref:Xaa-Pro dipeptidyl-peptidase C-terminal domain-containing protein n=1 Tax=Streptomyces peucetius TaxID=1950 RepID=A0ABY6IEG5_STRPE|nr:CocE/NonD family hydrolase C-terminal non-catalytic domain-containing protein [Streptomyces peucetius]UYQ65408.1 hypothetical protein OGH68_30735 [Streptomyces peucetius]